MFAACRFKPMRAGQTTRDAGIVVGQQADPVGGRRAYVASTAVCSRANAHECVRARFKLCQ
jgi:hypothetical protein